MRPIKRDGEAANSGCRWDNKDWPFQARGQAGLFYYYHVFAKAMAALGEDQFEDAKGVKHDWRKELFETLKSKQAADGSWANKNGAFLENVPELSTAFALLSLSYTTKK